MDLSILVVILVISIHSVVLAEIIPLERTEAGCPLLVVDVENAENNPQRVSLDTGSTHSYILNHTVMANLPRARNHARIAGFRGSLIPDAQVSQFDETHIDYYEFHGLRLQKWTRKRFTPAGPTPQYSWIQKFAVAALPDSQLARWDPNESGLIGMSQTSRFAEVHPRFGFIPRRNGEDLDLFVNEPINPAWCRDGLIVYTPVSDPDYWNFQSSRVTLSGESGNQFTISENFQILVDTGNGGIRLPPVIYNRFVNHLESLHIPSLDLAGNSFPIQYLSMIPDFTITLASGATITLPKNQFSRCYPILGDCSIDIYEKRSNLEWMTFGIQLFKTLIVEFDTSVRDHFQIGFCEPAGSAPDDSSSLPPPLITLPEASPTRRDNPAIPMISPPGTSSNSDVTPPLSTIITAPEANATRQEPARSTPDDSSSLPPPLITLPETSSTRQDYDVLPPPSHVPRSITPKPRIETPRRSVPRKPIYPFKEPLRIPRDTVEDPDSDDDNDGQVARMSKSAENETFGSDQKATRELQTYAIPIAMLVIASILIA
jgi:hypothetical protein